jgi:hypothetical protein
MRTQSIVNSFKTALVVAPLLASCGSTAPSGVIVDPNNGLMLPDCTEGQLIGINPDKSLSCVSALSGMLSPPTCLPGTEALTSEKDPVTMTTSLKCVVKGSGVNDATTSTRISNATTATMNLASMVTTIQSGGGVRSKFVGLSTALTTGAISVKTPGLPQAKTLCEADFGAGSGAHMCTPFEIFESVIAGNILNGSAAVGPAWVYMAAWSNPFPDPARDEPSAGLSDNCGAYTYGTADHKWRGTTMTYKLNQSSVYVPEFNSNTPCFTANLPIACCK